MNKLGVNFTVDDIDDAYLNATFETVNDILTHIESKFNKSLYEIFNMTGAMLRRQDVGTTTFDINVRELPTGTYLIKLTSEGMVQTKRFVKE